MALNDWNEEDHGRDRPDDEFGAGRVNGAGLFAIAALAGLYLVLVLVLLEALNI